MEIKKRIEELTNDLLRYQEAYYVQGKSLISDSEYDNIINYALDLGVINAYIQEGETSDESFIPPFDLEGL